MAKRYHNAKRSRRMYEEESRSPNHHPDHFNDEWRHEQDRGERGMLRGPLTRAEEWEGMPSDMRAGLERPEMIHEDHRAIANLPQEVMIKAYPKNGPYMPEDIDDTSRGVDAQMDYDDEQRARHYYPKKV